MDQTLLGQCVSTQQQAWSLLLGYLSIFCWLNAQIPQIVENFKLGSAASLSLPFLINWLLGDISNLIGCVLTHQLPFQLYLAIYFCIADVILFGQWIYYSRQEHRRKSLPDIAVADLPEIGQTGHHGSQTHPHHSRRNTTIATAAEGMQEVLRGTGRDLDPEQAESVSPLLQRPRPRTATTTTDIAHRRSTSMVLFGLVMLTMRHTLPALQQSSVPSSGSFTHNDSRVFARALDDEQSLGEGASLAEDPNIVQLGRIFAWVCTIFYLSSRMPQLWKNFKRKSVQGLSILMFFWAAMGNLTYTLSILNSADAVNPETRKKALLEAVPYVLGSSGTLMFDVSIFGQWLYYTGKLNVFGIHSKRYHHHHHHRRHHRSRSRGSRPISRVESMLLSSSPSQSGLYSILIDEEDPSLSEDHDAPQLSTLSTTPHTQAQDHSLQEHPREEHTH
ncbi:hypothetical protein KVV02_008334 [Mortierella alpina]|uniref:PQ loop repeat protein n=1 Tax=Mortierella alpina TaxID=64518 RepID=A0A9P8CYZ6_MORAP|nr:hypothetical protein KVV02_008334 [Mortierella alpina]